MTTAIMPTTARVRAATPYITVAGAAAAIDFYVRAFGAVELAGRWTDLEGRIGHAELAIGDAHVMLSDEYPEIDVRGPRTRGGPTSALVLAVDDADAVFA